MTKYQDIRGFTLVELLIVLAIFGIMIAGIYSAYTVQMHEGVREYRLAQTDMETQIAKSVIERDLAMAGYGLPYPLEVKDYCGKDSAGSAVAVTTCPSKYNCNSLNHCVPVAATASDGGTGSDVLRLSGTAIGMATRATQAWAYVTNANVLREWADSREKLKADNAAGHDRILYVNPLTGVMLTAAAADTITGKTWLFRYDGSSAGYGTTNPPANITTGDLVYGLYYKDLTSAEPTADLPYYSVSYSVGGTPLATCAPGTANLLRGESRANIFPSGTELQPLLNCVLDFQVALGLDANVDGAIDCWDDGGAVLSGNSDVRAAAREQLKQVRVYALVQQGGRDRDYSHVPSTIRVGDSLLTKCGGGGVGRDVTLTADQLRYRWKVVTVSVAPRNVR